MEARIHPTGVLLCEPSHFDIVDVKNPYMAAAQPVDKAVAHRQWTALAHAYESTATRVVVMPGLSGCEDMVFCANTTLTGLDRTGTARAIASRMAFPSRQREVQSAVETLAKVGIESIALVGDMRFEGGGDGVWHLGAHRLFAGYGYRTDLAAYEQVERVFECEIVPIELTSEHFYHLDTCLCVVDSDTAIINPNGMSRASYSDLTRHFKSVIEVDDAEALQFACNACSINGTVVIESSAVQTIEALKRRNIPVLPVETSEFMKSGGSVYCMKQYIF